MTREIFSAKDQPIYVVTWRTTYGAWNELVFSTRAAAESFLQSKRETSAVYDCEFRIENRTPPANAR